MSEETPRKYPYEPKARPSLRSHVWRLPCEGCPERHRRAQASSASGPMLTPPEEMVDGVLELTKDWDTPT